MSNSEQGDSASRRPDEEHYRVRNRQDILPILHAMATHKVAVKVQFAGRPGTIETRLLSVKPHYEELVFDAAGIGNLMFAAGETSLSVEATYDYIHVRFTAEHLEASMFHARPAFRACIPAAVTRSQRRGSMRFPVPSENPPVVRLRQGERGEELRMRVMDISSGGVCLILEDKRTAIDTGTRLAGCKLEFPRVGVIDTDLEVVYQDVVDPKSGWRRLGCRFSGMNMLALDRVRDYVTALEREHLGSATGPATPG